MNTNEYFSSIEAEVKQQYSLAAAARAKGVDPVRAVEIPIAMSLAEKTIGLISTVYPSLQDEKIVRRIIELEKEYGQLDIAVAFKIAEEIARERFCKFTSLLQAMDAGIRVGFAYITLGVVSSPIEGFTELKVGKTRQGEDYLIAYFSGPIRSAGTTASCVVLMLIDYLREAFGFALYDPDENEIRRYITENYDYHERVTNLQYLPTEEEIAFLARHLPIQISGDPTEDREVSNYKDLPRVETNFIRGGMCLIFSEGLAQKAQKGLRLLRGAQAKGFKATSWEFLEEYIALHKKREKGGADASPTYIKDLVAGRPVFSHPSRSGGFRFRYGRSRAGGFSATAVHPATMGISDCFLSVGTQLKIEKPTKGCAIAACDSIDGPIVRLKNGSVKHVRDLEDAKRLYSQVDEILYFGDLLVSFGDVANRNYELLKPGYVEEWWALALEKKIGSEVSFNIFDVSLEHAISLSQQHGVPLHPRWIFFWRELTYEHFAALIGWLAEGSIQNEKLVLPYTASQRILFAEGKKALELLGCDHDIGIEHVIIPSLETRALCLNIGVTPDSITSALANIRERVHEAPVLDIINSLSSYVIKDKSGTFIGARMGRPEKAKLRKLIGSPHVIFPVGEEGGRLRSVQAAVDVGKVTAEFPLFHCKACDRETVYPSCEACHSPCVKLCYSPSEDKVYLEPVVDGQKLPEYKRQQIDMKYYFEHAKKLLGLRGEEIPLVKGVRGTSSKDHSCEHLAKGLLRSKYNLHVNKDGTIRYDMTEMAVTHFKPREIGTSIEKLKAMGYEKDISGAALTSEEQILTMFPHDIILPSSPESPDERADDVFLKISQFVDDELEKLYGLPRFFNATKKDDLIGALVVNIAPHICTATVGRLIGFSKTQTLMASPYMHAAMRRDCVYPETKLFFYDQDTKNIFYDKIGDYVEKLISEGAKTKLIDSYGTISVENNKNLWTLGIDPKTHELKKKKIKHFVKGPVTQEWVKIKTATNREYVMTPTHKFMHISDGKFVFKDAKYAKVDDRLPVLEQMNFVLDKQEIDLIELFRERLSEEEKKGVVVVDKMSEREFEEYTGKGNENLFVRWKFSRHRIPSVIKINRDFMSFLGYYASEGHSRINKWVSQVGFRICNEDMQKDLNEIIRRTFGIESNKAESGSKITVCSKIVYYIMKTLGCGKGAYEKRVPRFIFGLDKERVADYLSAYYEGDGSVVRNNSIGFYSVSRNLLDDVALLLTKFGVIGRYSTTKERLPGKKVLERYKELGKEPRKHVLNHLILGKYDSYKILPYLKLVSKKKEAFAEIKPQEEKERYINYGGKQILMDAQSDYVEDRVKSVEIVNNPENSYCVEIEWKEKEDRNVLWGEQIINTRCDGDEAATMLLMDLLLNFSRKFLPAHRGGTQDAPLVLNVQIRAGDVDDQILDFELGHYPLELYEMAEQGKHSSEVKIDNVKSRLKEGKDPFTNILFTHPCTNINDAVLNSSYKSLPTMREKVDSMMALCKKLRAVDVRDVARLIIERHFIRDTRGNLRKFSMQAFRCVGCNEIFRRPPLVGKCTECGGRLIFTISEGSILKYMQPAMDLAKTYNVSPYLLESLELNQMYIESIFGREKEKQEALGKWF